MMMSYSGPVVFTNHFKKFLSAWSPKYTPATTLGCSVRYFCTHNWCSVVLRSTSWSSNPAPPVAANHVVQIKLEIPCTWCPHPNPISSILVFVDDRRKSRKDSQ